MRSAPALMAAALLLAGCQAVLAQEPKAVVVGQPFTLRPGGVAVLGGQALQLGFVAVTGDSRCPKGVACVWAGQAVLSVWWQAGTGARQQAELRSAPGPAPGTSIDAVLGAHLLRVVRVEPEPVAGRPLQQSGYVVTLVLTPAGARATGDVPARSGAVDR